MAELDGNYRPLKDPEDIRAISSYSVDATSGISGHKTGNEIHIPMPWGIVAGRGFSDFQDQVT